MSAIESHDVLRTAMILGPLILARGIALGFQRFSNVISIPISIPVMLIVAAYLFQSRKRERWLWSALLSIMFVWEAVKDFHRSGGGHSWMFWIDVCFFIVLTIVAVEEGTSAWRKHRQRQAGGPGAQP